MAKPAKKNSPRSEELPYRWPTEVWDIVRHRLGINKNSKGRSYYDEVPSVEDAEAPPAIQAERCHPATKSTRITVVYQSIEYSIAIHRARFMLAEYDKNDEEFPLSQAQASHICLDAVNVDGKGTFHCTNPQHMVSEYDKSNKSRQRCPGWIWIHPHDGHEGGYWYPTCIHDPPCIRYRSKTVVSTQLIQ